MESFGQHSSVNELLGQLQALAYERDALKFDGRVRHARKITRLLQDIGYKSLQLLDPVGRLVQVRVRCRTGGGKAAPPRA